MPVSATPGNLMTGAKTGHNVMPGFFYEKPARITSFTKLPDAQKVTRFCAASFLLRLYRLTSETHCNPATKEPCLQIHQVGS
jgi:hypothetical protein